MNTIPDSATPPHSIQKLHLLSWARQDLHDTQGELVPMHKVPRAPEEWGVGNTLQLVNMKKHMTCNTCNIFSSAVSITVLGKLFPALIYNYLCEKYLLQLEGDK